MGLMVYSMKEELVMSVCITANGDSLKSIHTTKKEVLQRRHILSLYSLNCRSIQKELGIFFRAYGVKIRKLCSRSSYKAHK
jgi:hypothetical protein